MTINKVKINTRTIEDQDFQKKMFLAIFGVFIISLSFYIFFISQTVFNIIERKTAESEMRTLSAKISNMEIEYISLAKSINLSLAGSMGFKEPANTYFASRRAAVGSLIMTADEL